MHSSWMLLVCDSVIFSFSIFFWSGAGYAVCGSSIVSMAGMGLQPADRVAGENL